MHCFLPCYRDEWTGISFRKGTIPYSYTSHTTSSCTSDWHVEAVWRGIIKSIIDPLYLFPLLKRVNSSLQKFPRYEHFWVTQIGFKISKTILVWVSLGQWFSMLTFFLISLHKPNKKIRNSQKYPWFHKIKSYSPFQLWSSPHSRHWSQFVFSMGESTILSKRAHGSLKPCLTHYSLVRVRKRRFPSPRRRKTGHISHSTKGCDERGRKIRLTIRSKRSPMGTNGRGKEVGCSCSCCNLCLRSSLQRGRTNTAMEEGVREGRVWMETTRITSHSNWTLQ